METGTRLVITGGGTGGHVFPALALASALRRRFPGIELLFIGARNRPEARLVPSAGWPFAGIAAAGLRGKKWFSFIINLALLPVGVVQSLYHLMRFWPQLVVGMGGYVAGPVGAAAWLLRRRVAIHEQNLTPGWTNGFLGRLADLVMVTFPETAASFPRRKVAVTGTPVREEALGHGGTAEENGLFRLLVLGGSQGARSLNQMFVNAMRRLTEKNLKIWHQTGTADEEWVREAYGRMGLEAEVAPFITEMGKAYCWADLVVCRSGASTIAELTVNGCPAILVPFPWSSGGHQEENARYLVGKGAALMIEHWGGESGKALAAEIEGLRKDRGKREKLSEASLGLSRPGAADEMAEACLSVVSGG
jgi:UDP-N-acetylglucosamine--N-acetylmuramyl-(pentapeptide) pyrophosphoryl-undecaprenol N-acetylglucosamine transferase